MELQSRDQTDDAFRNEKRRFRQCMRCCKLGFGELIDSPRAGNHNLVPEKPGQRLGTDATGREVFQTQHAPDFGRVSARALIRIANGW